MLILNNKAKGFTAGSGGSQCFLGFTLKVSTVETLVTQVKVLRIVQDAWYGESLIVNSYPKGGMTLSIIH